MYVVRLYVYLFVHTLDTTYSMIIIMATTTTTTKMIKKINTNTAEQSKSIDGESL